MEKHFPPIPPETIEYFKKQRAISKAHRESARKVPRAVRRISLHNRKPGTRRARKEMSKINRIARKYGLEI